ncbi:MAG: type III pantothenate kinase [Leptospiraceae bacterium]|nr:type III pantothenate kinase [Leptospiraceae bacterium]MDW8305669.1 type III pantothenate kinase [Leptospiraceae bacterium]
MLLVADIGNTEVVFGLWRGKNLLSTSRVRTKNYGTKDEWNWLLRFWLMSEGAHFRHLEVEEAVVCSVVPSLTEEIMEGIYSLGARRVGQVRYNMKLPFRFNYPHPETLGEDRLANAIAGVTFYGEDLIIVDIGTAITFCLIEEATYCGGVIAPGPLAGAAALFEKTAKLPQVELAHSHDVLGKSTVEAMEAGLYFGYRGLIAEIVKSLKQRASPRAQAKLQVIVTGGLSTRLSYLQDIADVIDQQLTLKGLRVARDLLF